MPDSPTPERARSPWLRVLAAIAICVVLLAGISAATFAWLTSDTERVRVALQNLVTSLTGQALLINGEFDYELGRIVTVRATELEWRNPEWSSTPNMLTIGAAEASIDLLSIINRPILLTHVMARDAVLEFEWTADDRFNWSFDAITRDTKAKDYKNPLPLLLDEARLENISIRSVLVHSGKLRMVPLPFSVALLVW